VEIPFADFNSFGKAKGMLANTAFQEAFRHLTAPIPISVIETARLTTDLGALSHQEIAGLFVVFTAGGRNRGQTYLGEVVLKKRKIFISEKRLLAGTEFVLAHKERQPEKYVRLSEASDISVVTDYNPL
jgi:hypothetical protein